MGFLPSQVQLHSRIREYHVPFMWVSVGFMRNKADSSTYTVRHAESMPSNSKQLQHSCKAAVATADKTAAKY